MAKSIVYKIRATSIGQRLGCKVVLVTNSTIINTVDRTITTGNPQLKPTTDNSFDLAIDYYPLRSSYFSVGIFDKEIANYIFQR